LSDSQYKSYFNQILIVLEQCAKHDNFKAKPIRENIKLPSETQCICNWWIGYELKLIYPSKIVKT